MPARQRPTLIAAYLLSASRFRRICDDGDTGAAISWDERRARRH
jgi:hypothetical protein